MTLFRCQDLFLIGTVKVIFYILRCVYLVYLSITNIILPTTRQATESLVNPCFSALFSRLTTYIHLKNEMIVEENTKTIIKLQML